MIEIGIKEGDTFMIREIEFRVDMVNKQKNRVGATRVNEVVSLLQKGERFLIGDTTYMVTYVKDKSKYISLIPVCYGH